MPELKTVVPGQLVIGGQINPDQVVDLARQGFKTLISNRPDGEEASQPGADQVRRAAEKQGMDYVHIPVTVDTIARADVEAFHSAMSHKSKPVFAHCGTGRRAYLLWAAGQALFEQVPADDLLEQGKKLGIDVSVLPQIIARSSATQ